MMILLLGACTAALQAQTYDVYVLGGGSTLLDKKSYTVYGADFQSDYTTGPTFTVGAEIPVFRKNLSAEGSYEYVHNNLAVYNLVNSSALNNEIGYGVQDQRVSADIVAHPAKPLKGIEPYFDAGIELDRFSATSSGAQTAKSEGFNGVPNTTLSAENLFGYNFGFGLDISLTHMIAIRLDARDHRFTSPTFGLPSAATTAFTAYYPISGHAQDVEYSAGFVFRFGK